MTERTEALLSSPSLEPLLPMLYVAWADGELTDDEIDTIRSKSKPWVSDECIPILEDWLDRDKPPTSTQLLRLLRGVRTRSEKLDKKARLGLADLGLAIAEADAESREWVTPEVRRALEEIEDSLGLIGSETTRDLVEQEDQVDTEAAEPPPEFDVVEMTRWLDGPYHERKQSVRGILQNSGFEHVYDIDKQTSRARTTASLNKLADEGLGKLGFPDVTTDTDLGHFVATFETLAEWDQSLVVKFGVQFGLWGGSVYHLGTEKHHQKYLPGTASMEMPGCFAMSELGHGSNVRDLETVAQYDTETEEFIIHTPSELARKEWIGNAARDGKYATVFAQLEVEDDGFGVHAFVVPIRDDNGDPLPGVSIADCGHKMGLNGVDNGRLWFDHVRIPRENLLDRYATVTPDGVYDSPIASPSKRFFVMLGTLVGGRIAVAAAGMSVAKAALIIATRYATRRRQFGPSGAQEQVIMDYLSHKRRILPRIAKSYAISAAHHELVQEYLGRDPDDTRELEAFAAGMKAYATWHATDTVQECREACGGQGYLTVNRFADLKADSDIFTTFEGDNTVLMQLVAKGRLTQFRDQFSDSRIFGMVRYLARQATQAVSERNPIVTRETGSEHLRSAEFLLGAFRFREEDLVRTAAQRMQRRISEQGMDPFDALNECQDHLISMANATVENRILASFERAIDDATDDEKPILRKLFALYGLNQLHQDIGWFLENGYIVAAKASAIRSEVNQLCEELRPQVVHLVNAFGIPDELLDAPIGTGAIGG